MATYLEESGETQQKIALLASAVRKGALALGLELAGAEPRQSGITTLRGPSDVVSAACKAAFAAGFTVKHAPPTNEPLRRNETTRGGFLRISPHIYNTEGEIDALFDVLRRAI